MSDPTPTAGPAAVVYPPDGTVSPFTVINLGAGAVQMGDSVHDRRLPALWFGKNGQGMGHEEVMDREAREGETLAVVTFANVEGLDVLASVIQRIRRVSFPDAGADTAQSSAERVEALKFELRQAMIDYGAAVLSRDPDRTRETSERGVRVIDSLAPLVDHASTPAPAERQPLTNERMLDIADSFKSQYTHGGTTFDEFDALGFARAIEAAHGINATPAATGDAP